MNDADPRLAVLSSHNTVHHPTCPSAQKLKTPRRVYVKPAESWSWSSVIAEVGGSEISVMTANCCGLHYRTKEIHQTVWTSGKDVPE